MPLHLGDALPEVVPGSHPALSFISEQRGNPVVLFLLRAFT
jgi:hypothetical protein